MNGLKLRYLLSDLAVYRGRVLDIGCGAGSVAKAVKRERPDLDVVGCDVSRSALAVANVDPEGVEFKAAEAERLPNDALLGAGVVEARLTKQLGPGTGHREGT